MKLSNGYGSIIKLKGARRAPWAVRISYLEEQADGTVKRKRKYLAYFAEQKSAISYLAEYNNGAAVREHQRFVDSPTFSELYEKWRKYRRGLKSNPSASTWKNYGIAFGMFTPVHHRKVQLEHAHAPHEPEPLPPRLPLYLRRPGGQYRHEHHMQEADHGPCPPERLGHRLQDRRLRRRDHGRLYGEAPGRPNPGGQQAPRLLLV